MASSSRSSEGAGDPIEVEAVTVEEGSRDRRTSEQRGKLGVAPAAGIQAHKKKQSVMGALAKGDFKEVGRQSMEFVRSPIRALAGGKDGQNAARMKAMTFNIKELDPDADGDGVVSAFEQAVYDRLQRMDRDGDGKLSVHELYDVVEEAVAAKQDKQFFKMLFFGTAAVVAILLLCLTAIMAALLAVFKDTYTNPDIAMMRTSSGKVVMANMAKYPLPLYTAPVLDKAQLYSIEQLTVKVADQDQNATAQSGHRIAATRWYSDTRVIFETTTGAEIKVWDGKATFKATFNGKQQEVCAADVSCSAFLVDDVNRQEAVIEEANKALADKNLELSRGGQSLRRRLSALRLAAKEGRQLQTSTEDDCDLVNDELFDPRPPPPPPGIWVGGIYTEASPPPLAANNPPQTPPPPSGSNMVQTGYRWNMLLFWLSRFATWFHLHRRSLPLPCW
jgi:hypothetical protein